MNVPQISVPSSFTESTPKPHTVYNISVRLPLRSFLLRKRYSDFDQLHQDLTSAVGASPPTDLPPKTYFKSTISNFAFAEERRKGLEQYLLAIQGNQDSRWRDSPPWRQFLNLPSSTSNYESSSTSVSSHLTSLGSSSLTDPVLWLDAHREMKSFLQDARSGISRRDQTLSTADQHDASAAAKKALVKASGLLDSLDKELMSLTTDPKRGGLGDGEIRRRKDLIASGRKERDALEALVNSLSSRKPQVGGRDSPDVVVTNEALRTATGNLQNRSTGRILGAPVPETDRTRQLDNTGVLQLQKEIMENQDQGLEVLHKALGRTKQVTLEIGQALTDQVTFLDEFGGDVDRVENKLRVVKKRVKKIS